MKTKNNKVCNKIRSVKSWLSMAEDDFTKKNDVRGELNLLLAEAELQHLREKESNVKAKSLQLMALLTAVFLVLVVLGGWAAYDRYKFKNYQRAVASNNEVMKNYINYIKALNVNLMTTEDNVQVVAVHKVEQPVVYKEDEVVIEQNSVNEPNKKIFSDEQMRDFVRTAGKTLRGE